MTEIAVSKPFARISACWIAKDEETELAASIMSVSECAHELIVVDTGSSDATARVALECGARVERFVWNEDFSAARNFALSRASGDCIIFIDADEYFSPPLTKFDRAVISEIFKTTGADAIQVPRVEIEAATGEVAGVSPYIRIVRRGLRYEGRVHEVPKLHIKSTLSSKHYKDNECEAKHTHNCKVKEIQAQEIQGADIPRVYLARQFRLVHTGYSSGRNTRKLLRNVRLLEMQKPELTNALSAFHNEGYLMREYMALGDYERAFASCRYLLDNDERWGEACKLYSSYIERFYIIIQLASERPDWFNLDEIRLKAFGGIERNFPGTREAALAQLCCRMIFSYDLDYTLEHMRRFVTELAVAEKLIERLPQSAGMGRLEATVFGRGALAARDLGDVQTARRWAKAALALEPRRNAEVLGELAGK